MDDLRVAEKICDRFSLELNDRRRFENFPLSARESFDVFHALNTGVSYTTYLPVEGPSPYKVSFGGGGGEIHRRFYENHQGSNSPEDFVARQAAWLADEYARDGWSALELAQYPGVDLLRLHYREFRHRFHVGRAPRYRTVFTPLDSVSADGAQSKAGSARLDEGQFNYDVISSLSPELLEMPFDKPAKAPSASIRSRLAQVSIPSVPNPGKVWAAAPPTRSVTNSSVQRAQYVRDAIDRAAEWPFVNSFWGDSVIGQARELAERMLDGTGIGNAVNGKPISALLSAELVVPN
jgi:hypothetical protein